MLCLYGLNHLKKSTKLYEYTFLPNCYLHLNMSTLCLIPYLQYEELRDCDSKNDTKQ